MPPSTQPSPPFAEPASEDFAAASAAAAGLGSQEALAPGPADGENAGPDRSPTATSHSDDAISVHRPDFRVAALLAFTGLLGVAAAFVLLVEKIALLRDPAYVPSCSINPVLSCGSIMTTSQAEVLGFPNPILGLVGFTVVTTVGLALLAGAHLARWFWIGLQAGTTLGVLFVHWLIFQSLYRIGALCPYCMLVWVVTITIFLAVTRRNITHGIIPSSRLMKQITAYTPTVLTAWLLSISTLVTIRFWEYWTLQLRAAGSSLRSAALSPTGWMAIGATLYLLILAAALMQRRRRRRGPPR